MGTKEVSGRTTAYGPVRLRVEELELAAFERRRTKAMVGVYSLATAFGAVTLVLESGNETLMGLTAFLTFVAAVGAIDAVSELRCEKKTGKDVVREREETDWLRTD